jgi:Mg-chelatase subunit ChlD
MSASNTTDSTNPCREVEDTLTDLLEGTAPARLHDHVAECDACRDLKHEATLTAERVRDAAADFHPADDFVEKLVGRLLAQAEAPRVEASPRSAASIASGRASATVPSVESPPVPESEGERTTFDPLAGALAAEAHAASEHLITQRSERGAPGPTRAEEPSPLLAGAEPVALPALPTAPPSGGRVTTATSATTQPGVSSKPAPARARREPRRPLSLLRKPSVLVSAFAAMAAAASIGFYLKGRTPGPLAPPSDSAWSGAVSSVSRASADTSSGLESCDGRGTCAPIAQGASVAAGSTVRTDARTRAHLKLQDGTDLALDRATEVELSTGRTRAARLVRGTVVADVAHIDGATARFTIPRGEVEVLGTRLAISVADDRASVEVARGSVRVTNDAGRSVDVRAGEEAALAGSADPIVTNATTLADVMEWSDDKPEDVDSPVLRGLGELRARRPGQTTEKDRAVRLSKHAVKIRIVDIVARTEVDETFTNDTDEELEGIYRFPLPPGAQIEKLSLEVDGKLVDGAFVDRDKGAAIWRGVIHNAAPKAPKPREEIIWVPGPWRDPALLEWQRGGRFELKIFPIPRRGSRRVVLTYTQTVDQSAGVRRFTYPLAHDASGSTKVGAFDLDLQVLGQDRSVPIATRGYELVGDADRRTLHADGFVPAGDLTVEYALPDRAKDVTAWAYAAPPDALPQRARPEPKSTDDKAAAQAADAILDDRSPYVAIALRPKLPRWQEAKERVHVIVVDASRSMFGERFARATHLASAIVREMDRRDTFLVLACDTVCRPMTSERGGTAGAAAPGAAAAGDVERFLGGLEPEGGSDLAAAIAAARAAAGSLGGKELRVLYLGDGTPSVGPTRPGHLETAVRASVASSDTAVIAVPLGADADTTSLAALARGGGGVVVPYVPGQKIASAALEVLGAAYGLVLKDAEVELPSGLSQVTPGRMDPIRAGGETILVARMSGGANVAGTMKLRGRIGGERFERTYPIDVVASSSAGNAFVPRLYAAAKIAELERVGETQKSTVVELSKRFSVASRFTSLLVLESEAMFKAFGLDRTSPTGSFTGEHLAESSTSRTDEETPTDVDAKAGRDEFSPLAGPMPSAAAKRATAAPDFGGAHADAFGSVDGAGKGGGGFGEGSGHNRNAAPVVQSPMATAAPMALPQAPPPPAAMAAEKSPWDSGGPAKAKKKCVASDPLCRDDGANAWDDFPRRRQRMIPMRRVFERHVGFDGSNAFLAQNAARLMVVESAVAAAPDSRDKTVELFSLYSTTGRVGEAQELTARWAARDALDPEALRARADLAARQGDRDRAVRILGGLADLRPDDRAVQTQLATLWETAGNAALACEHRIALADLAPTEPRALATAITCARAQGMTDLASVLRQDAGEKIREALDRLLASAPSTSPTGSGDVQITAEWTGGADLDVALIDAQGRRTSWLGSATKATVSARDATSGSRETLQIAGLPQGNYVLEVDRAAGRDRGDTLRGEVTLRLNGETRRVPFSVIGPRVELGTVRVFFTSHLEPVGGGF